MRFTVKRILGNKKGPFSRIVKTALVGEKIEWR